MDSDPIALRRISADEAFPLRAFVLRPNLPPEGSRYPQDEHPATRILGAFQGDRLVGTISLLPEDQDDRPGPPDQHRIRGMVVVDDLRGAGVGSRLLSAGIAECRALGRSLVWCNGRTPALAFYRRHGFEPVGEEFDSPGTGPHYRLVLPLR